MANIQFKYNKSAWHDLNKQLKMRELALPTLKSKEAALRLEVKKAKKQAQEYDEKLKKKQHQIRDMLRLWAEFDSDLVQLEDVVYEVKTIAGVKIPVINSLKFKLTPISQFHHPDWFLDGIAILEELTRLTLLRDVAFKSMEILEYARKKTTQKVNLYEKVQIPAFEEAMRKIKRFLEDEENLSKSAQKILKRKKEKQREL